MANLYNNDPPQCADNKGPLLRRIPQDLEQQSRALARLGDLCNKLESRLACVCSEPGEKCPAPPDANKVVRRDTIANAIVDRTIGMEIIATRLENILKLLEL